MAGSEWRMYCRGCANSGLRLAVGKGGELRHPARGQLSRMVRLGAKVHTGVAGSVSGI